MKKSLFYIFILSLKIVLIAQSSFSNLQAQTGGLSFDRQVELLQLEAIDALTEENYSGFLRTIEQLEELGMALEPEEVYYKAFALSETGRIEQALETVSEYLDMAGTSHVLYRDGLTLYRDLEYSVAQMNERRAREERLYGQVTNSELSNSARLDHARNYLREFSGGRFRTEVHAAKGELIFQVGKENRNRQLLNEYISGYPDGQHVDEANRIIEQMAFRDAQRSGTLEAYLTFLNAHPNSPYSRDVYDSAVDIYNTRIDARQSQVSLARRNNNRAGVLGMASLGSVIGGTALVVYSFDSDSTDDPTVMEYVQFVGGLFMIAGGIGGTIGFFSRAFSFQDRIDNHRRAINHYENALQGLQQQFSFEVSAQYNPQFNSPGLALRLNF
jgi:tetratricopeptide (TPR) repeat protein